MRFEELQRVARWDEGNLNEVFLDYLTAIVNVALTSTYVETLHEEVMNFIIYQKSSTSKLACFWPVYLNVSCFIYSILSGVDLCIG